MSGPLSWIEDTHDIGSRGRRVERTASASEREALAAALGILGCESLTLACHVRPIGGGRYRLEGRLAASVVQSCVVTLEPVASEIAESIALEYWPYELMAAADTTASRPGAEQAILEVEEREALPAGGRIETGQLAYEIVAAALDPYPRKAGAELDWTDPSDGEARAARDSPFAVLRGLKVGEES